MTEEQDVRHYQGQQSQQQQKRRPRRGQREWREKREKDDELQQQKRHPRRGQRQRDLEIAEQEGQSAATVLYPDTYRGSTLFGRYILEKMAQRRLTITQVAQHLGVRRGQFVYLLQNKGTQLSLPQLNQLARSIGADLPEFFARFYAQREGQLTEKEVVDVGILISLYESIPREYAPVARQLLEQVLLYPREMAQFLVEWERTPEPLRSQVPERYSRVVRDLMVEENITPTTTTTTAK